MISIFGSRSYSLFYFIVNEYMKFETALNRTARDDIIYISIGSNVPNSATQQKITTQQLPKYIKSAAGKGKKASVTEPSDRF